MKIRVLLALLVLFIPIVSCSPGPEPWPEPEYQPPESQPPNYNTPLEEIESNPAYWNMAWEGEEDTLVALVDIVASGYIRSHTYIEGETDCNDMVIDVWNLLHTQGVTSIITFGNLDVEQETFSQCNHTWLTVYICSPATIFVEVTAGQVVPHEYVDPYRVGYDYVKPSDLRRDLEERW